MVWREGGQPVDILQVSSSFAHALTTFTLWLCLKEKPDKENRLHLPIEAFWKLKKKSF